MRSGLAPAACLFLAVGLVACGGDGDGEGPSGPAGPTAPTEPPVSNGIDVSPTGDDAAAGTMGAPLRSIEAGVERLALRVLVDAGLPPRDRALTPYAQAR